MNLINTAYASEETTSSTEHTATPSGLAAGAQALGLDGRLLAAQIINFIILVLVLRKFLYNPLVGLMEKRRSGIEESLKKADLINKQYTEFQIEHEVRINEAKAEVADILAQAKKSAEVLQQETVAATQLEADRLISKASTEIERQKTTMLSDLKKEIGGLVILTTTKLIGETEASKLDLKAIEEALLEVKS